MNRQFIIDRLKDLRVIADAAEQMAPDVRRLAAAISEMVHHLKGVYACLKPPSGSR
ncbi:hypothetical protein ACGFMK_26000 [Amycolatopsis sp. NPDC049252]|uniref:hypothetical protein n=1 Tax=Amycolatopsis sp. NPDC049252 TaxID=3363933 RepID=UPI003723258C